jgi:hypothetical protein
LLVRGWNLLLLLLLLLLGHIHVDIPGLVQRGERRKKSMRKKTGEKGLPICRRQTDVN